MTNEQMIEHLEAAKRQYHICLDTHAVRLADAEIDAVLTALRAAPAAPSLVALVLEWQAATKAGKQEDPDFTENQRQAVLAEQALLTWTPREPAGPETPVCAVCRTEYPTTGMQTGPAFSLVIAGRGVCRRCVEAGRDAKRAAGPETP